MSLFENRSTLLLSIVPKNSPSLKNSSKGDALISIDSPRLLITFFVVSLSFELKAPESGV